LEAASLAKATKAAISLCLLSTVEHLKYLSKPGSGLHNTLKRGILHHIGEKNFGSRRAPYGSLFASACERPSEQTAP